MIILFLLISTQISGKVRGEHVEAPDVPAVDHAGHRVLQGALVILPGGQQVVYHLSATDM